MVTPRHATFVLPAEQSTLYRLVAVDLNDGGYVFSLRVAAGARILYRQSSEGVSPEQAFPMAFLL